MKQLTKETWMTPDPIIASGVFVRLSMTDGTVEPMGPDQWAEQFLAPQLSPSVPTEVRELFEVARGAMLYGSLFYPLFTLGLEQVYRVADTAATMKAKASGVSLLTKPDPKTKKQRRKTFAMLLGELRNRNVLSKDEHAEWRGIRHLRNASSHPERQTILPPGMAAGLLISLTETINRLFHSPNP